MSEKNSKNRRKVYGISLSPNERKEMQKKAEKRGLDFSTFVRIKCLIEEEEKNE